MNNNQEILPIALVMPHGGLDIPPELNGRIALTPTQIFNEADAYIDDIFDFRNQVLYYETFPYARCILDLNRSLDTVPHRHRTGDGVVKRNSSYGDPVYIEGQEPDEQLEATLLETYYTPWHNRLAQIANDSRVKLVIDCHSMASTGPAAYENPFQRRPRVMVGNMGDKQGNVQPDFGLVTASAELTKMAAEAFGDALADIQAFSDGGARTAVNDPYWGGWNLRAHGGKNQPWMMVELSRALYVGEQTAVSPIVPPHPEQIALLRERVWQAINQIMKMMAVAV